MPSKRQGAGAIAYQAAPGTAAAAPVFDLICESIDITASPQFYDRQNPVTAAKLKPKHSGFDPGFSINNLQPSADVMGYLLWLFLGDETRALDVHTIDPQFDSHYFTVFKDVADEFASGIQVQTAYGCRIETMTIDQQSKDFANVTVGGIACGYGTDADALAPSLTLSDDTEPLSWNALRDGDFKLGYNSETRVSDGDITSVKFDFNRTLARTGAKLDTDVHAGVNQDGRVLGIELTRDFLGDTAAQAEYLLWSQTADSYISVEAKWLMGTYYVSIILPRVKILGPDNLYPEVGTGVDAIVSTVMGEAYIDESSVEIAVETKDGSEVDFDAL